MGDVTGDGYTKVTAGDDPKDIGDCWAFVWVFIKHYEWPKVRDKKRFPNGLEAAAWGRAREDELMRGNGAMFAGTIYYGVDRTPTEHQVRRDVAVVVAEFFERMAGEAGGGGVV